MNNDLLEKLEITPGPWEARKQTVNRWWQINGENSLVGVFNPCCNEGRSVHLIASAPEMLEALIDVTFVMEKSSTVGGSRGGTLAIERHIEIIEKVTGKTWPEIKELLND